MFHIDPTCFLILYLFSALACAPCAHCASLHSFAGCHCCRFDCLVQYHVDIINSKFLLVASPTTGTPRVHCSVRSSCMLRWSEPVHTNKTTSLENTSLDLTLLSIFPSMKISHALPSSNDHAFALPGLLRSLLVTRSLCRQRQTRSFSMHPQNASRTYIRYEESARYSSFAACFGSTFG